MGLTILNEFVTEEGISLLNLYLSLEKFTYQKELSGFRGVLTYSIVAHTTRSDKAAGRKSIKLPNHLQRGIVSLTSQQLLLDSPTSYIYQQIKTQWQQAGYQVSDIMEPNQPSASLYRFDFEGYDIEGFNKDGVTRDGFGRDGFNQSGFDREGYGRDGYNSEGYNRNGFDRQGYNKEGFDITGFNVAGLDREGYARDGYGIDGFNREGYDCEGYGRDGYNAEGLNRNGQPKPSPEESQIPPS